MATPEEVKENSRNRQRAKRERDRLAKERAQGFVAPEVDAEQALNDHMINLSWAQEFDATGKRYKSECRPLVDLLAIYEGADILNKEDDEDEEEERKKKNKPDKKQNRPLPYRQPVKIRATQFDDNSLGDDLKVTVDIDPNAFTYKTLKGDEVNLKLMYEVNGILPFRRWLDLRDKTRKDLFWQGRLLGCSLFSKTHQQICNMFVKKNFDGLYFEDYTKDDMHDMIGAQKRVAVDGETPTRTMLLFAPRSGYKSTIDGLDAVQWLLNNPDTRIMIMTSVKRLAAMFMAEIKSYFYLPKRAQPSTFQVLFPEYVITGIDGRSKEPFKCPAAMFLHKEHSVWITSMDMSSVGSRCDIRKMDDVVEDKNSKDEELRETLKEKIGATNNLVEGWGFTDVIGTRYFTADWYGWRMSKDENGKDPAPYAYLSISAWTPKPKFKARYEYLLTIPNGMFEVTKDMVDLWFPYKLHWEELQTKLKENKERGFKNQQLNIATDPKELNVFVNNFDLASLQATTYARTAAPKEMEIVQLWDIAYSDNRPSDFSVGAMVGIFKDKHQQLGVVVLDVVYDKWKSSELASQMLAFYEKHKAVVSRVYIEEANGVGFLMGNIKNLAKIRGSAFEHYVRLRPVSVKPNAKTLRFKDLEFLHANSRLFFVTGAWIDELYKQFTEYNGKKSTAYRKDDIPDAISLVIEHLPPTSLQHNPDPKEVEKEHEERLAKEMREGWRNRMFGGHSPTAPKSAAPLLEAPPPRDSRQELLKKLVGKILPSNMRI